GAFLRHRKHPSRRLARRARISELTDFDHVGLIAILDDPVVTREPAVDDVIDDVPADFLGAEEHRRDFVIVDPGKNAAILKRDLVPRAIEKLDRGSLHAATGQPDAQRRFWKA